MTGDSGKVEHVDVLIVGAGISGIGGAVHLQQQRPGTSFVLLDALDSFGGTWWTHRYPGIRSDSDLFTFGYGFKPWLGPPIASADEILKYLGEVIDENDLEPHIRYHHRVDTAEWSTDERRVEGHRPPHRHRRGAALHRRLPLDVPGLLPAQHRLHAGVAGLRRLRGRGDPPAGVARRRRPHRQAGGRDRLGRHRRHAHPEHRRRLRPRHDAPALTHLLHLAAQLQRAGRHPARPRDPRRVDPRDRPPPDLQDAGLHDEDVPRAAGDGAPVPDRRRPGPSCRRASTSRSTSTRATGRGSSGSPCSPTATCSSRSRRGRPRSSPTRSRRSTPRASSSPPASASTPTW